MLRQSLSNFALWDNNAIMLPNSAFVEMRGINQVIVVVKVFAAEAGVGKVSWSPVLCVLKELHWH